MLARRRAPGHAPALPRGLAQDGGLHLRRDPRRPAVMAELDRADRGSARPRSAHDLAGAGVEASDPRVEVGDPRRNHQ